MPKIYQSQIKDMNLQETYEPTGFPLDPLTGEVDKSASTLSFVDGTRTFSIAPTGSSFYILDNNIKYEFTVSQDLVISADEGLHYIYFENGVLVETTTFDINLIYSKAFVAYVYYDATNGKALLFDERHGIKMDGHTHARFHQDNGTLFLSGGALNSILVDQDGSNVTHAQLGVAATNIKDEDLLHNLSALTAPASIPVLYFDGANIRWDTNTGYAFLNTGTGRVAFNDSATLAEADSGNYVLYHIFSTPGITTQYFSMMGDIQYTNLTTARFEATNEITRINLVLSDVVAEFSLLGTVIVQTSDSFTNAPKARFISTTEGDDYTDFRGASKATNGLPIVAHNNTSGRDKANSHPTKAIEFRNDGTTNVSSLADYLDRVTGATTMSGFDITNNGDGTVTLTGGELALRNADSDTAEIRVYTIAGDTLSLADNQTNFIYADYNAGNPILNFNQDVTVIPGTDELLIYKVTRVGIALDVNDLRGLSVNALVKYARKNYATEGYLHAPGGTVISPSGVLGFSVSAGTFYLVNKLFAQGAMDSQVDNFTYVYGDAGNGWTRVPAQSALDYLNYYDGAGGLAAIGNNDYGAHYVFMTISNSGNPSRLFVVYGDESYNTVSEAQAAEVPSDLPPELDGDSCGVFIGKLITSEKDATSYVDYQSPFTQTLTSTTPTSHNGLTDLQLAQAGVTYGHIDDQPQTIAGAKTFTDNAVFNGDVTVNGTTTIINSETLEVEDKNITLGNVTTPTDLTADGGGFTLLGDTNKTFSWVNATDAWTSSEHIDVAVGKEIRIGGASIDTGGTLSNVAYLDQDNVFTGENVIPLIKPSTDSTTAIQITKADGTTSVLNVDTTNDVLQTAITNYEDNVTADNDIPNKKYTDSSAIKYAIALG